MAKEEAQPDPLAAEVARCIDAHGLLRPREHVLVGVSGGADSVALLDVLGRLAAEPERCYRLTAAHLDHGLRAESGADAAFVAEVARQRGLRCIVERREAAAVAHRDGLGLEEAARKVRYAFLADAACAAGAGRVAAGHHADDNVETILQRIIRGTHLRGLAGMPIKRPMTPGEPGLLLVRPLLHCRRSEIEAYCRRHALTWRTDPTNVDTTYRRNFIRHELLPLLRRLNPQAEEAVLRLAGTADDVETFLADQAERALAAAAQEIDTGRAVLDAAALAAQHPLLRRYVLRAALERMGAPMQALDARALRALSALAEGPAPAAMDLPGPHRACRDGPHLIVEAAGRAQPAIGKRRAAPALLVEAHQADEDWSGEIHLNCPGRTDLPDGRQIVCQALPLDRRELAAHVADPPPGVEWLDAEAVRGRLTCRRRRHGDAFVPLGAPGTKSVSDFLSDLKLPARERRQVLCILDDVGLVYLAPHRIADRVKIAPHTTRVLRVEIRPAGQ